MSNVELITKQLGNHILKNIETSTTIYILTSFVMKSGVNLIKSALLKADSIGADIKLCTGDYLYITQPDALNELLSLDSKIETRIWNSNGVSFHPKAYLFQRENSETFFIGSSNLSKSALEHGVEWNVSISNEGLIFQQALNEFLEIFYSPKTQPLNNETLKEYERRYEAFHSSNPNLPKVWSESEEKDLMLPIASKENEQLPDKIKEKMIEYRTIQPRFAQLEALEELQRTIEEDYSKALVVMATGLGKTYLAGFFARNFKRILFIAHREEILYQAKESFEKIMPDRTYGIYNGKIKDFEANTVFASIYTLSMKRHLEVFSSEEFDLIVVDEFHHAAAKSYDRVIDYFQPKFLLGITATPDRNDNKDVYALCDGNVAYRLDFLKAIERNWLSPFKYYGVYDDSDYSQISWLGTRYNEEELQQIQLREDMAKKILQAWCRYKQSRTIGFCSSIKQANFLSRYFNNYGYRTVSLHSKQHEIGRKVAIKKLDEGELDIIFTVDLFNEGVDIPSVDTLLFARPTESLTVFTQQIGRGLRLHESKQYCVIIDLIGNYRNADIKLSLFDTEHTNKKSKKMEPVVPELCEISLDLEVIDLLNELKKKKQPRKERLLQDYLDLKMELGRRPTYLELHLQCASDSAVYRQEFETYYTFLQWADELSEPEKMVLNRYLDWIKDVEKTGMTKSYKMVILLAMLERGSSLWFTPITSVKVAPFFHKYLTEKEYRKKIDFSDKTTSKLWDYDVKGVSKLISDMPMTKWSSSSPDLLAFSNDTLRIEFEILEEDQETLYNITKEICEYRLHYHFERKGN